ncbi:MAG: protoheme IX farnesyltransferase [Burkholderiales bacterium]|nr:MAG: protoheme IX farnesyltransferase [Burkholderiales bacterium]
MKAFFDLFKLRIGFVIALTALAGLLVSPGGAGPGAGAATVLVLAVLVSSAAAGAFNQYYEVDLDRRMRRTRALRFVSGRARRDPGGWLPLMAALVIASTTAAWLAANTAAALFTFLGAFVYAIVYTVWLKRRTWWNIVIGGLAGSFAVLAGAAAVSPTLSADALILALVLFLWTPPHFWSLAIAFREDYEAAGVPMLPVVTGDAVAARAILVHAIVLVAASLALALLSPGPLYAACAAAGGMLFIRRAWQLYRVPDRPHAMRCFKASLLQLGVLLIGVMLDAGLRSAIAG